MIIGVPKEIKNNENRVGAVLSGVRDLVSAGHQVLIESGAGLGSGIHDHEYREAGAIIVNKPTEVWEKSEMVMKVKEPLPPEFELMREGQILYTFFHLAAEPKLTKQLIHAKVKAVAYETIQLPNGTLPCLKPMSEVAGKMSTQIGAYFLQKDRKDKGKGILLGGVPGVGRGLVTIIGAGVAGTNAAKIAVGLGAQVTILDTNLNRLEYLDDIFGGKIVTLKSNQTNIEESVKGTDLLIGAVLVAGAKAPRLVTSEMISKMDQGSVVIDISIDQGGCIETIRPTSHEQPIFEVDGVIHYGVTNIPGAVARTSTYALTNTTIPYALKIAELGLEKAAKGDSALSRGINVYNGMVTCEPVAKDLGYHYTPIDSLW